MVKQEVIKIYPRTIYNGPGDEIVISGISGRYPNAIDLHELEYNLYNKIDMVDDDERRWRHDNAEIPKRSGKIYDIEKFDASFFGVNVKQAHAMDPQSRILTEKTYEAILDAGVNPKTLRGSKTGVFIGATFSESENKWFYEKVEGGGVGVVGCSRAMLANRISYSLGLEGPSCLIDTACSSSLYALDVAFTAMRNGDCDAALVGAANLLLHPYITMQFARLGVLAANGMCRPFDANASGYVRSEAISVIFLQKSRVAKRIYSTVVYSKTSCDGYKEEGITYPSGKKQAKLLKEFYKEINIKPETVDYVEAHGTGTIVGDPEECCALDEVFCTNRKTPMPVGSVKSNLGHSEAAAGMCSIAKCILAMENGLIPPNINFSKINPAIKSLVENRLQVVNNTQKLDGPLLALNSIGFGGANVHCLLRAHTKAKTNYGIPSDTMPRLVNWSGRTENACNTIHEALSSQTLDVEHIALLHSTQNESVSGNVFKSYGVYKHEEHSNAQCIKKEVQHFNGIKRPIVYVFSGMGSQWSGMGASLLEVPVFRQSIQKAHHLLESKNLNLFNIITSPDEMFDNIVHSFVGITAIQAALCDCLKALHIQPDYLIGHSVGELGCAYADNCLTMEQMVLCAYSRGIASLEVSPMKGSMAAIGLSYSKIKNLVPPTIDIACHNGPNSCTISGPQNEIEKFVDKLAADGIFVQEVPCSNIAYHSRYISNIGHNLLEYLLEIIQVPKKRSEKWLSTSIPKDDWDQPESQYCSAQYQTNNLLSSVLFEETTLLIPPNAILIEIAPHGLLQSILRKSLSNAIYIPLTQRDNKQNLDFFLSALGRIYINGIDMAIENLYPKIEFPVSRGTGRISHLIKWDHTEDFYVMKYVAQKGKSGEKKILVSLQNQNYEYITGHTVDGRCLFPVMGYLSLVWETFGGINGKLFSDVNVQFNDVKFLRDTVINAEISVEFLVMIHVGTGRFEITEGSVAVVTGYIKNFTCDTKLTNLPALNKNDYPYLQTKDFYKELRLRGYHYNGLFRNMIEARSDGLHGRVRWDSNWVSFMHSLLQILIFGRDTRCLLAPTRIEKIIIDTTRHKEFLNKFDSDSSKNQFLEIFVDTNLKICQAGGIEIKDLQTKLVARRKDLIEPVIEKYQFIPYLPTTKMTELNAARFCLQHAMENRITPSVKCVELLNNNTTPFITKLKEAIEGTPITSGDLLILTSEQIEFDNIKIADDTLLSQTNCIFIVKSHCLAELEFFERSKLSLLHYGYIISRERANLQPNQIFTPHGFNLNAVIPLDNETIVLLQCKSHEIPKERIPIKISLEDKQFEWLEQFKTDKALNFLVYSQNEPLSGIIGLVNCIRKEPNGSNVICVFIDDQTAPPFNTDDPFYKKQLELNYAINVYRNGQWGAYRHLAHNEIIQAKPSDKHIFANLAQSGDLTSLQWLSGPYSKEFADKQTKIQFAALNFRDVKLGVGKQVVGVYDGRRLRQEYVLGNEYSGIDSKGNKIMGMGKSGAIGSHIISDPGLTWQCPKYWSLEQAATVPLAYGIVYKALILQAQIKKGNSILIHIGTGGVGLAAIRVALAYGLTVFTTVSSKEKREYLLKTFSNLQDCHIGNSRNISFERMIKLQTNGAGVDYVLNLSADEKLHASLRCLAKGGKFLEIVKPDMPDDIKIGLDEILKEITVHMILVDNLFITSLEEKMVLQMLMQKDINAGIIQPLPATIYAASDIESAFRFLASAKHIGKVLLKIREDPYDNFSLPITIYPRISCPGTASYVVVGGLGGFGLELIDWLIIRGAQNVVIPSRGNSKPYQINRIKVWESYGVVVKIIISNIGTETGCETILKEAMKLGPVAGIFNLAVDLQDGILENQTAEKFIKSFTPKVFATNHLDQLSRKLCPKLDHFTVFSSVTSGRGNPGQTNYGMANSVMERIIEQRCHQNLPGKAIQWGAIGDVGLLTDMQDEKHDIVIAGTLQQKISSCLEHLDHILLSDSPIICSMVVAEKRACTNSDNIMSNIMNIMTIRDVKSISMNATLTELGMDSLMAVEIKQMLERDFDIISSIQNLRTLTFDKLNKLNEQTKQSIISEK